MMRLAIALVALVILVSPVWAQKSPLSATSPDGKLTATAKDQKVTVSDTGTQKATVTVSAHQADITGLSFSPDGKLLGSVDGDGKVNLFDVGSGRLILTVRTQKGAAGLSFSGQGKTIEVKIANKTRKFDVSTGKEQ